MNNLAPKLTSYSVASIYLLLAVSTVFLREALGSANFVEIDGKSFSVYSQLRSVSENGQLSFLCEFFESYSVEQKRAIINYKITTSRAGDPKSHKEGTWFIDMLNGNTVLHLDDETSECKESSLQEFKDSFRFYVPELKRPPSEYYSGDYNKTGDYIAGPGRLLLFVEKSHNLAVLSMERMTIRNLNCIRFDIDYVESNGDKYNFNSYYSELSLSQDNRAHPIEIVMSHNNGKNMVIASYTAVRSDDQNMPQIEISRFDPKNARIFDQFVFEPIGSCAKARESNALNLFDVRGKDPLTPKFSFRANVETLTKADRNSDAETKSMPVFVAYDSSLKSMRVDMLDNPNPLAPNLKTEKQIFNFQINRKYHIMKTNEAAGEATAATAAAASTSECLVTRLVEPPNRRPLTTGELLAGADKFVYLGRAQVRGISAYVYESSPSSARSLPFWLEQPIVYLNERKDRREMRSPSSGVEPKDETYKWANVNTTILLYFSGIYLDSPLLMIEYFAFDEMFLLERKSIQIFDFAWDLIESADGDRGPELFSLQDSCADTKEGSVASFKLLLESNELIEPLGEEARSPSARNLALLASLQEKFRLPITMVSDMETKLVRGDKSKVQQSSVYKMVATFEAAAHTSKMVQLIYLGKGRRFGSKAKRFVGSFEECFHTAAHREINLHFGYNLNKRTCFINFGPIVFDETKNKDKLDAFDLDNSGPLEIYSTRHFEDPKLSDYSYWIREVPGDRSGILGTFMKFPQLHSGIRDLSFTVKGVQKEFDQPNGAAPSEFNQTSGSAIAGFGLPESASGNRRVLPNYWTNSTLIPLSHEIESDEQNDGSVTVNFEQCHAACLADFNCKSFSVCIRNGQVECVISKISFRSSKVLKQLFEAPKSAKVVSVELDDNSNVELTRHPNCELRNKNFIELFTRRTDAAQNLRARRAVAARSREDCAETCFLDNLRVLRQDVAKVRDVFSALAGYTELQIGGGVDEGNIEQSILSGQKFNATEFEQLIADHRAATKQFCNRIYYLDRQQLIGSEGNINYDERLRDMLLVKTNETIGSEETSGYCLKVDRRRILIDPNDELFKKDFNVEIYDFKAELFYEKQYGIGLKDSALFRPESDAYLEIKRKGAKAAMPGSIAIMRSLIKRGYNFQELIYDNPNDCARACFAQMIDIWPACRSFDVYIGRLVWCRLNTVTLGQVKARGMAANLTVLPSADARLWHYEPRAGFIQEESLLSGELEMEKEAKDAGLLAKEQSANSGLGNSFGLIFIIVLAAMICGSVLGIWRGKQILAAEEDGDSSSQLGNTTNQVDTSNLVETQPKVSYLNQPNQEGEITVEWDS